MFQISGIVKKKMETKQITDTFQKREFVVTESSGMYPQDILFELTQDRTGLVDNINENDMVTVTFNIRGREWINPENEAKYFVSLNAWKVEKMNAGSPAGGQQAGAAGSNSDFTQKSADDAETLVDESDDDLPF